MEITNITKISMGEVASLAENGIYACERNSFREDIVTSALEAIEKVLQEHLDEAVEVYVNGVELNNAEQVTLRSELTDDEFLVVMTFRDADDKAVASWRVSPDSCAYIWVTSYGHGSIFITYGSKR